MRNRSVATPVVTGRNPALPATPDRALNDTGCSPGTIFAAARWHAPKLGRPNVPGRSRHPEPLLRSRTSTPSSSDVTLRIHRQRATKANAMAGSNGTPAAQDTPSPNHHCARADHRAQAARGSAPSLSTGPGLLSQARPTNPKAAGKAQYPRDAAPVHTRADARAKIHRLPLHPGRGPASSQGHLKPPLSCCHHECQHAHAR